MGNTSLPDSLAIADLASRIEVDIRRKKLQPGLRYARTADTARMLGASTGAANRAMQLLVHRGILERRKRAGTFIGQDFGKERPGLRHVHILLYDPHVQAEGFFDSGFLLGLQSALPGAHIRFDLMPEAMAGEEKFLGRLLEEALRLPEAHGFILVHSTVLMQHHFLRSGLPTVLWGHPYPSVRGLSFLERDQRQSGRLIAEYLIGQGRSRLGLLLRERRGLGPGEYLMLEGLGEKAEALGLSARAILLRTMPHEPSIIRAEVGALLEEAEELPGLIVRPPTMAKVVLEELAARGLTPGRDIAVVMDNSYARRDSPPPPLPFLRSVCDEQQQGVRVGEMLAASARGEPAVSEEFAVELEVAHLPAPRRARNTPR